MIHLLFHVWRNNIRPLGGGCRRCDRTRLLWAWHEAERYPNGFAELSRVLREWNKSL